MSTLDNDFIKGTYMIYIAMLKRLPEHKLGWSRDQNLYFVFLVGEEVKKKRNPRHEMFLVFSRLLLMTYVYLLYFNV